MLWKIAGQLQRQMTIKTHHLKTHYWYVSSKYQACEN